MSDLQLVATLRALRDAEARVEAPAHLEAAVMAAWDAPRNRAASRVHRPWHAAGSLAAGLVLAASLALLGSRLATLGTAPAGPVATMLLLGEPIRAGEAVRVVRMRIPGSTLAALGVRSTAGELADLVDVDVIIGEDGVARAIQF